MRAEQPNPRQAARQIRLYLDGGDRDRLIMALALLEPEPEDGIELHAIHITRQLGEDGETYAVDYDGEVGWLAGLGLLEAAKWDLYERCNTPKEAP